jgi:hypothetical protein
MQWDQSDSQSFSSPVVSGGVVTPAPLLRAVAAAVAHSPVSTLALRRLRSPRGLVGAQGPAEVGGHCCEAAGRRSVQPGAGHALRRWLPGHASGAVRTRVTLSGAPMADWTRSLSCHPLPPPHSPVPPPCSIHGDSRLSRLLLPATEPTYPPTACYNHPASLSTRSASTCCLVHCHLPSKAYPFLPYATFPVA